MGLRAPFAKPKYLKFGGPDWPIDKSPAQKSANQNHLPFHVLITLRRTQSHSSDHSFSPEHRTNKPYPTHTQSSNSEPQLPKPIAHRLIWLIKMGASRKLQGEIDRVLKKVQEGVDVFDSIWNKVSVNYLPVLLGFVAIQLNTWCITSLHSSNDWCTASVCK